MKGINKKIARSMPDSRKVRSDLNKYVDYYTVQRAEGMNGRDDFEKHTFKNIEGANKFLSKESLTAPEYGNGYDKTDVEVHYKDGKTDKIRLDLQRDGDNTIDGYFYREQLYHVEKPYDDMRENNYCGKDYVFVKGYYKNGHRIKPYCRRR